ncbi:MAG: gluconolaconase, partial [Candidatus Sericytochromatia bacterium]
DAEDHRIRVLAPLPEGGYTVSTLAGDGVAGWANGPLASARFNRPASLALDPEGRLYVADYWNHRLQVIEAGEVRTVTGGPNDAYVDGPVGVARFSKPVAVAIGPDGAIYVADSYPHGVRKVSP